MIDEIKEQVDRVLCFSQNIPSTNLDEIMNTWYKNKQYFINKFGGPIYEVHEPIKFSLCDEDKEQLKKGFIIKLDNDDLAHYLKNHVSLDGFFSNTTTEDYEYYSTIKAGMKLSKAFKYFIDDCDELRKVQDKYSEVVQKNKVEGILCLSVHPLDFLSSSENCENWRSCHALDGDYKSGNLSYMLDETTFIAYVKAKEDKILPRFPLDLPWNSKKWRCLMFISNDRSMMFAGRQYPFESSGIMSETLATINDAGLGFRNKWFSTQFSNAIDPNGMNIKISNRYYPVGNELKPIRELVRDVSDLHYDDLLYSTYYTKLLYTYVDEWFTMNAPNISANPNLTKFKIGSLVPCVHCGEYNICDSSTMLCHRCDRAYGHSDDEECSCCGEWFDRDEMLIDPDGHPICPDCYSEEVAVCASCGDEYWISQMVYDDRREDWVCNGCARGDNY